MSSRFRGTGRRATEGQSCYECGAHEMALTPPPQGVASSGILAPRPTRRKASGGVIGIARISSSRTRERRDTSASFTTSSATRAISRRWLGDQRWHWARRSIHQTAFLELEIGLEIERSGAPNLGYRNDHPEIMLGDGLGGVQGLGEHRGVVGCEFELVGFLGPKAARRKGRTPSRSAVTATRTRPRKSLATLGAGCSPDE